MLVNMYGFKYLVFSDHSQYHWNTEVDKRTSLWFILFHQIILLIQNTQKCSYGCWQVLTNWSIHVHVQCSTADSHRFLTKINRIPKHNLHRVSQKPYIVYFCLCVVSIKSITQKTCFYLGKRKKFWWLSSVRISTNGFKHFSKCLDYSMPWEIDI